MAERTKEDFEDLTSEEEAEQNSQESTPRQRSQRAPRASRAERTQREPKVKMSRKERKALGIKKRGGKLKVILIILLVLLVGGFVAEEVYFNWLGTRDMLIDAVLLLDPNVRTRGYRLDAREAELKEKEEAFAEKERIISNRELQADRRATELDRRQADLAEREERATPLYRRRMSEQDLSDMVSLSRSYSQMTPESAAAILVELDKAEDVAAILFYMSERNAAAILAVMEPEFAAHITSILLYN
ncbi:MAG: hypothetical protein FWG88_07650 [Oscillospiraceae bacterium]|nr:hypothetical protein [Oscillospiraceae bacterium]